MKTVAVSQRVDDYPERYERRDALDQKLSCFLIDCGLNPIPVPNGLIDLTVGKGIKTNKLGGWIDAFKPDAILLSGGNDIGSCQDRDNTENFLIQFAKQENLPLLGICRGMQMMATLAGSNLHPVSDHVRTRHILQGSEFAREVNSYHNMSIDTCPHDYQVIAKSDDGEIEAIRHDVLPWEGWMWHPEREESFDCHDISRIKKIL